MARAGGGIYLVDSEEAGQDNSIYFNDGLVRGTTLACSIMVEPQDVDRLDAVNHVSIYPSNHSLDKKYPHRCFNKNCRMPLSFRELLGRNAKVQLTFEQFKRDGAHLHFYDYQEYKHLKKLWKSKYVKFLCCQCYDNREFERIKNINKEKKK